MAEILIVSGSYFPNATANAVCAKKLEDALKARGHNVYCCIRKHDLYQEDRYMLDGTEITTVGKNSDLFYQSVEKLKSLDLPNGMNGAFALSMRSFSALMKLRNIEKNKARIRRDARKHYLLSYASKIADLVCEHNIDLILSVSMPFDSHAAVREAMDMLNEDRRPAWIAYCIDAYWSKAGVSDKDIPEFKKEEKEIFDRCDRILFLDTITKDYDGSEYDLYREKMASLPLPLFELIEEDNINDGFTAEKDSVNVVFTGTIYDDFSNADACCSILEKFAGMPYVLHFMGKIYPKSADSLVKTAEKMPGQIKTYGRMPYSFAKGSMQKADILLNLANDNSNQIPSKIFEYMACCKPILNIYKKADDVGTSYLMKYPLAFNYNAADGFEEQTERLIQWAKSCGERSITISELDAIFHNITTPVVTEKFCDLAEKTIKDKRK